MPELDGLLRPVSCGKRPFIDGVRTPVAYSSYTCSSIAIYIFSTHYKNILGLLQPHFRLSQYDHTGADSGGGGGIPPFPGLSQYELRQVYRALSTRSTDVYADIKRATSNR